MSLFSTKNISKQNIYAISVLQPFKAVQHTLLSDCSNNAAKKKFEEFEQIGFKFYSLPTGNPLNPK